MILSFIGTAVFTTLWLSAGTVMGYVAFEPLLSKEY